MVKITIKNRQRWRKFCSWFFKVRSNLDFYAKMYYIKNERKGVGVLSYPRLRLQYRIRLYGNIQADFILAVYYYPL